MAAPIRQRPTPVVKSGAIGKILTKSELQAQVDSIKSKIPTSKSALFRFPIQWNYLTDSVIKDKTVCLPVASNRLRLFKQKL